MEETISREVVYAKAGREDRVTMFRTKSGSQSQYAFGTYFIGIVLYTQLEREELENNLHSSPLESTSGVLNIRMSLSEKDPNPEPPLPNVSVPTEEIAVVDAYGLPSVNRFSDLSDRTSRDIVVHVAPAASGRDYDLIYLLKHAQVVNGHRLSPDEWNRYYAMHLFFKPDEALSLYRDEIFVNGTMRKEVEFHLLGFKCVRNEVNSDELKRSTELLQEQRVRRFRLLQKNLSSLGVSFTKLFTTNPDLLTELWHRVMYFNEGQLNVFGKVHVYLDLERYLHIVLRHVREFMISKQVVEKDFFQWKEPEIMRVMERVVQALDSKIQRHFRERPGKAFWISGKRSLYFEGDYYTVQISANGRLLTLYRNKKILPPR
jgi:hypothetical protein